MTPATPTPLARLNPTPVERARLADALETIAGALPPRWETDCFDALGVDAFDLLELVVATEFSFGCELDIGLTGDHTVADLLAALRLAPKWGALPHG
jgi:acyl carrier protein